MADRNMDTFRRVARYTTREGMELELPPSDFLKMHEVPGVVDPFSESSIQLFPLGSKLTYADRTFRYGKNGAVALIAGGLVQSVVPLVGHADEVIDEPAAGTFVISFTPAVDSTDDLAVDDLEGGYIWVVDEVGEGILYRIKSHPAIAGAVAGNITLYDSIITVPAAGATATVIHHPLRNVIIHPSPNTAPVVGATVIPVTANFFTWFQTGGPAAILTDGTVIIGEHVRISDAAVNGSVEPLNRDGTDEDEQEVGVVLIASADTEYSLIKLNLE